jgi:protein-export membrane protein SecD/preprotein translocase SecF subunit
MNERDMWWKIAIVGALVALAFASVYPIDEKIKFGIDLAGGYSLLYEIDDTGLSNAAKADLNERVMRVLKKRVDPKGVFNLVWRPVGRNRLEIQMPRPSDEVIAARRQSEALQEEIRQTVLHRSKILAAISKDPAVRQAAIEKLAGPLQSRIPLLEAAAGAQDELKAVQQAYDQRVAQIEQDNLTETQVLDAVEKPAEQRDAALEALVGGIPARRALLEAAAKAWDAFAAAPVGDQPTEGPTSQPTDAAGLKRAYDEAVRKVLGANVDPDSLTEGVTINEVVRLEELADEAIGKVIATNIDLVQLQTLLDMDKEDAARAAGIEELNATHTELSYLINGLVDAADQLSQRRRGEGRLEDPADLQRLLKGAGVLDFRILPAPDPSNASFDAYRETLKKRGPRPLPGEERFQWFEIENPADFLRLDNPEVEFEQRKNSLGIIAERFGDKYYVLAHIGEDFAMTHRSSDRKDWTLASAQFTRDQSGSPAIGFNLDEVGGVKFGRLTRLNKGKQLCIFLDDQAISNAIIEAVITTSGIIRGQFSPQEVQDMVKKLNAGSLPQKLKDPPISVRSIGPSLGEANRTAGLNSAKYGALCVAIFMLIYYFYAGGVAVIAVAFNILFIGAMMAAMGGTLTLPGIAGLVLAIGMAVDANVLINERIREELARGTALRMAFKLGYERAFRAILDSNVTTVLTCVILYMVGTEEVKGFGLTLGIGVFINIFTAYFITRMFFELMAMISIPQEIIRYPIFVGLGATALGGVIYGLGYWFSDAAARDASVSMAFGNALMDIGPCIVGLLILMYIARVVHGGRSTLPMLRLIGVPKIAWVAKRRVFFGVSAILLAVSVFAFTTLDNDRLYDIEFLGGTSAQIDLKEAGSLDQTAIAERLETSAATLDGFGKAIAGVKVTGTSGTYTLEATGVPAVRLEPVLKDVLDKQLRQGRSIDYSDPAAESVTVQVRDDAQFNPDALGSILAKRFDQAADAIRSAQVQAISGVDLGSETDKSFEIVTREPSKEIVVEAITENLENDIDIQPTLTFRLQQNPDLGGLTYFPIRQTNPEALGVPLSQSEAASIDLEGWTGGVAIALDDVDPPQRVDVLQDRLKAMRLQPGFEKYGWRESRVFGLTPTSPGGDIYQRLLVVVVDENFPLEDEQGGLSTQWQSSLAEPEVELLEAALTRQTSLSHVTQFDQQVSGEAKIQAYLALGLSWLLIIAYVWFRFGNIRWGLAAVAALIHDVTIAAGCVAATYYVAGSPLGKMLMIDQGFRIDLAMVAALLTVIGYSVNDTIVVFDRIRENRGRLTEVTPQMVDDSISQTLSRTLLTFLTSLISVLIMYVLGGRGIHSFSFVLIIGLAVGTYSSIGIASQFLLRRSQLAPR